MNQPIPDALCLPDQKDLLNAWNIAAEEVDELEEAILKRDIVEIADGVIDCMYTIPQIAIACGIDIVPLWKAVHEANMAKAGGPVDKRTGKRLKPPGWQHPDIAMLLQAQYFPLTEAAEMAAVDKEYEE